MNRKTRNLIPFTRARLVALQPQGRAQAYFYDSQCPGLAVCVSPRSKTFYRIGRVNGRFLRVRLGTFPPMSVEAARKACAVLAGQIAQGGEPAMTRRQPTLGALWAHWDLYAKAHKRPSSWKEDQRQYNVFLKAWEGRKLASIRKQDVQALHARIGTENGTYAANRVLSLLAAMYNKAPDIGYRGENPCKGIVKFKEQSRDRFLQGDELPRFFQALAEERDPYPDFFSLALLTGARKGNVQGMRWEDLNLESGLWRIPGEVAKAGEVIVVPLLPQAVEILQRRREQVNGSPWVFPSRGKTGHLSQVNAAWARILKRAGLVDLRIHDLRRTLGSYMAMQGASLLVVGKALGHRRSLSTEVYARLQVDPVRAAMTAGAQAMLEAAHEGEKRESDGELTGALL